MKRVISVYLPNWPTDRLRMITGTPARDKPFVTVRDEGSQRLLAAVDDEAYKLGLREGHTLAYARAITRNFLIAHADDKADFEGLHKIALEFLRLYSPIVGIPMNGNIVLDVTGCAHLFGGEKELLDNISGWLNARKITARVALADTIGSASAFAIWGRYPIHFIEPGRQMRMMKRLPVAALRLSDSTVDGLQRLGFMKVGDLYNKPRAPFVLRFGKEVIARLDQAQGAMYELIEPIEVPQIPQVQCSFTEPALNPEFIERAISQLSERLCKELETKGLGARRLDLIYHRADQSYHAIRIGTVSPMRSTKHFMRLFKEHFDKVEYGFGIEKLTLRATLAEFFTAKQTVNEFGAQEQTGVLDLVDILNNRLGREHVYQVKAVESDVPERSIRRTAPLLKGLSSWPKFLMRPPRLLVHPEKVRALALLPDHAPSQFLWRDKHHRIKRADGPERIYGEWWRRATETMAVRDYFLVENYDGERFWLFRRGDGVDSRTGTQEWFIHGFFG